MRKKSDFENACKCLKDVLFCLNSSCGLSPDAIRRIVDGFLVSLAVDNLYSAAVISGQNRESPK
jgi:hypothetical protein